MNARQWLGLLTISIYVSGESSPTVINSSDADYIDVIIARKTCMEDGACTEPAAVLSTGPFTLKALDGVNCYVIPYINSNGTLPISPADWTKCPS